MKMRSMKSWRQFLKASNSSWASSHLFIILDYSNTISVPCVGRQRAPRKPRPPTKGKLLDNMTKAMGRRLPIEIAPGKKRPEKPVQAAKLASEAGIVIRSSVPILTHWKEYKKDEDTHVNEFMGQLAVSKFFPSIPICYLP